MQNENGLKLHKVKTMSAMKIVLKQHVMLENGWEQTRNRLKSNTGLSFGGFAGDSKAIIIWTTKTIWRFVFFFLHIFLTDQERLYALT